MLYLQMLMSVKSLECAANCVSTQKEVSNAIAERAISWSQTNVAVKQ